jgi:hypothetical protein
MNNYRDRTRRAVNVTYIPVGVIGRTVILSYVLLWQFIPFLYAVYELDAVSQLMQLTLIIVNLLTTMLLLFPFYRDRIGGTEIGWVHPLTVPALLNIASDLIKTPMTLFSPLVIFGFAPPKFYSHILAESLSNQDVLLGELLGQTMIFTAQLSLLIGYVAFNPLLKRRYTDPTLQTDMQHVSMWRAIVVLIIGSGAFLFLTVSSGGVVSYFSSLAFGRAVVTEQYGPLIAIIRVLPFILVYLYASKPALIRNPLFWIGVGICLIMSFISSGSRSGIFVSLAALILAWMCISRRLPATASVGLIMAAVLLMGTLGDLRKSAVKTGETDVSVLSGLSDINSAMERSREHAEKSDFVRGDRAVFLSVPTMVGHLWGATYLGSLAFFIPRAIWSEKPRSSGAFVGALVYEGRSEVTRYEGAGFPTGAEAEAYWNFGFPGVVIVFALFGSFLKYVVVWYRACSADPFRITTFVLVCLIFNSPSGEAFPAFIHTFVILYVINKFVKIDRRSSRAN